MADRHKTDFQIQKILKYNHDGSPDHQQNRYRVLMRIVEQLRELGYSKRWDVHTLGKKEVHRLVNLWRKHGNTHRTIANKMVELRWLASKVNREDQVPSNKDIGIALRSSSPDYQIDRAEPLLKEHLDQMSPRMQLINELKAEFGIREKEACKF